MARSKKSSKKSPVKKAKTVTKTVTNGSSKWGKDNARLSRDPEQLLARFQEQEASRYEKIVRIRERAEKLGDKKTAAAAKKIEKKLASFAA